MALMGTDVPAHQLRELARPGRVSLIAMATHGRGGIRRFILGSVTDKLVRTAEVPVLVVPPVPEPGERGRQSPNECERSASVRNSPRHSCSVRLRLHEGLFTAASGSFRCRRVRLYSAAHLILA